MKIIIYCQHVLGVGHFFRTLEIVKALADYDLDDYDLNDLNRTDSGRDFFDIILVTGGGAIDVDLPSKVRHVKLPGLMMDENFSQLHSVDPGKTIDEVKEQRREKLLDLVKKEAPDIFLIELYPFGRRAFRFELVPVLDYIKNGKNLACKVLCSLRDILVEKQNTQKYETRVIEALNKWFDAVLIHSDPQLINLDATFTRMKRINIPLVYTGFVTPVPDPEKVKSIKKRSGLGDCGKLIVASAGGGNVGAKLLHAVLQAFLKLDLAQDVQLQLYTGPYMDKKDKKLLKTFASDRIKVEEFTSDFVSLLGAADLSISMAGYNTCMNIVAAKIPSLVWPFGQNREQKKRALALADFAQMTLLEDSDLLPERLCTLIEQQITPKKETFEKSLNIDGARYTAQWIGGI